MEFVKRILANTYFVAGHTHTHFIPDHKTELEPKEFSNDNIASLIAALSFSQKKKVFTGGTEALTNPWTTLSGFRN